MAVVRAYRSFDSTDTSISFGSVSSFSNNHITITSGSSSGTYRGSFTYDASGRVFGQINSYVQVENGQIAYEVNELNLDAYETFSASQSGDSSDILSVAFQNADTFYGSQQADLLDGYAGNDGIFGDNGNDVLIGSAGDDILHGGLGIDTAVYSGNQSSYTLTLSPTENTLIDRRTNGDGTDMLIEMELLDFSTGTFNLEQFGGTTGLSEQNFESFIELYIAYFDRAPDAIGLNFWGTAFANGTTLEEMATLFVDQDETLAAYPTGTTNSVFAETVYNNVLGRTPDQIGFDFWVGQLDSGSVSRDQFILNVLQGAKSDLKTELGQDFVDQQLADKNYLDNKVDIGAYFAVHKGMSEGWQAEDVMEIFGDQDTSNINGALAAIDGYYANALDPTQGEFLMPLVGVLDDPFAMA